MSSTIWIIFGVCGWIFAILGMTMVTARMRRASLGRAYKLRTHIRPYLARRAQEASIEVPETTGTSVTALVDDLCGLAEQLTRHERGDAASADTMNMMAVSDTQPLITEDP